MNSKRIAIAFVLLAIGMVGSRLRGLPVAKPEVSRSTASQVVIAKLTLQDTKKAGLPPTLWLGIIENKEWSIGYRHAWGEAVVSTRQDLGDRYPIQHLRFRLDGPNGVLGDKTCDNAAECSVDNKYWGTVVGDFSANWHAWATDPSYGTWETSNDW